MLRKTPDNHGPAPSGPLLSVLQHHVIGFQVAVHNRSLRQPLDFHRSPAPSQPSLACPAALQFGTPSCSARGALTAFASKPCALTCSAARCFRA
eukprot:1157067-Pelagomonas_calceolata.AAC.12